MTYRWPFALLLALATVAAGKADEVDDALRAIQATGKEGAGAPAARRAWDRLVARGPVVLPRILRALDTPDTVTANWLRTAFDRIAEAELKTGGKRIDADALLKFARDARHRGRARRLALETVERLRPGTTRRLLPGWLEDPEFRYDAVEERLAVLGRDKAMPRDKAVAAYRELFAATRDVDQSRRVAERLKGLGIRVSVADHLGFLRDWYVIGPFDAHGMKGFKTVYPPERKVDLKQELPGKGGAQLRWKRYRVAETPSGRFPILVDLRVPLGGAEDAVAYAFTSFTAGRAQEAEFRGSADDNLTVWVNGVRAFGFEEYRNGVRLDRHRFRVRLRAGRNIILVKVCQAPHDPSSPEPNWEFLLRLTDDKGKGIIFKSALEQP
jgi:hypothetical protein